MSSTSEQLPRVAVVVSGWPRLSETFALHELVALERAGMLVGVYATKAGETGPRHPGVDRLGPRVHHLREATAEAQADELAGLLAGRDVSLVHGYFGHRPAEVAAAAASRLGVPYGVGVHALDARKVAPADLARRLAGAALVVACNADVAATVTAAGVTPRLVAHGVDLDAFAATPPPGARTAQLLAVGRLVEKKGFGHLLDAVARVDRDLRLRLVGDGPLRERLVAQVRRLGLDGRVRVEARRTHASLPECYADADLVVVPSVVDGRGDRDGLPNVVLEAMASGRPVVASDVGAIGTAVRDGVTGRLVPPGDPAALAEAVTDLLDRPDLRRSLGTAARAVAETEFGLADRTADFCRAIGAARGTATEVARV